MATIMTRELMRQGIITPITTASTLQIGAALPQVAGLVYPEVILRRHGRGAAPAAEQHRRAEPQQPRPAAPHPCQLILG